MKNFLTMTVALIGCCATLGCGGCNYEPPPIIIPKDDSLCQAACDHMAQTHYAYAERSDVPCEESTPAPLHDGGSITCVDLCKYEARNGVGWNNECLVTIKTCEEITDVCKM